MKNLLNYTASVAFLIGVIFMTGFFDSNVFAQVSEVDATFNPAVKKDVTSNVTGNPVWQADGKTLIYGVFQTGGTYLNRLNTDGTTDATFNCSVCHLINVYNALSLPDGKVIVAGFSDVPKIYRLNSDGSVDATFNGVSPAGSNEIYAIEALVAQPDGKILVRRESRTGPGTFQEIFRLNADGSYDTSFTQINFGPFMFSRIVYSRILVLPSGKIHLSGTTSNGTSSSGFIIRVNSDGTLDASFDSGTGFDVAPQKIELQTDGKILVIGDFTTYNGTAKSRIARLNSDGSLDNSFNATFNSSFLYSVLPLANGKILVGGNFITIGNALRSGIARITVPAIQNVTEFDFDGDGKADVSVFRASENKWYILQSSNGQVIQKTFAISGDVPVPADFDGDGKTDVAIFRQSTGDWWSLSSINNAQINTHWGQSGDILRPSDFDGDGRADYVLFRPAENNWYRISSSNDASSTKLFGLAGDKPITGDFDGDGKFDVAIFRPSTGNWWWQSSVDNVQRATRWGISTDIPSPADYDGDGKTDFAVYRPSTGTWYILNSSNGQATIINFGISEDEPVAADYDGDGKADIAVFRPSTGIWYLLRSTAGFTALQFGVSTDVPTPNAFVP